jgi:outer membrane receptor protein involved in Fe transport
LTVLPLRFHTLIPIRHESSSRWIGITFLGLALSSTAVLAAENQIVVAAGPLATAISELSRQAGVSIGGDLPLGGHQSLGVSGNLTPEAALERLLTGTGLGFRTVAPGTYRLIKLPPPVRHVSISVPASDDIAPIIVTATKRGADPADLPVSVGVLTSNDLSRFGNPDTDSVLPLLGGVSSTHLGPGRNKLSIRGLSDSAFTGQTQSTVGLYLDNAKVNYNAPDPNLRLIDVERVEVLRGPQGTLYGGGSIGGILRIIPATPDLSERSVSANVSGSLTKGGNPGGSVEAVLNQPLITDRLGVRLALYADRQGGVIDEAGGRKNIDSTDVQGGRLLLAYVLAAGWKLELGGTYQLIDTDDSHYIQGSSGCCTRAAQLAEPHDNDFDEAHLTLTGQLGWADLHSTTAFVRHEIDTIYDASTAVPDLAGLPAAPARFHEGQLSRLWTHETRLSGGGDAPSLREDEQSHFQWLTGLYLSHQTARSDRTLALASAPTTALWQRNRDDEATEAAFFGEISWTFHPDWTLTAGGRLFYVGQEVNAIAAVPGTDLTAGSTAEAYARELDYTPKLALTWRPWRGARFYAQMTEGYRPGGINIEEGGVTAAAGDDYRAARFRTDELWNYELGAKLDLWDERLFLDAAIFHARWRNIQTDQLRANGLIYTTNAGDGNNTGIEIGPRLHWGPWRLAATLILNDPELSRIDPDFSASRDGELPDTAHASGAVSLSWRGTVVDAVEMEAVLDYSYTGRTRLTFENGIHQGPVDLLNGRVRFQLSDSWAATLSVDNILDSRANQFAYGNPFTLGTTPQTTPPRPRTVALSIGWRD